VVLNHYVIFADVLINRDMRDVTRAEVAGSSKTSRFHV
jgi:hypothetical protein